MPWEKDCSTILSKTKSSISIDIFDDYNRANGLLGEFSKKYTAEITNQLRFEVLESEISALKKQVVDLQTSRATMLIINTIIDDEVECTRPFAVSLTSSDSECTVTFSDANLSSSGISEAEAVERLKELIVDTFLLLDSLDESVFGPGPLLEYKSLSMILKKK